MDGHVDHGESELDDFISLLYNNSNLNTSCETQHLAFSLLYCRIVTANDFFLALLRLREGETTIPSRALQCSDLFDRLRELRFPRSIVW